MNRSSNEAVADTVPSAKHGLGKANSIEISKDWTIMVYMAGDNNLSQDMIYSLRSLQDAVAATAPNVNVMLYFDGNGRDTPTVYYDLSDPSAPFDELALSVKKRQRRKKPRSAPDFNENAAAMYSLYDFVDWCISKGESRRGRTARKYALIVSGHGSGFQNLSFLHDERSNFYMTIPRFRETLSWIVSDFLNGEKLDLIGFDNCVMGMLEVAHELVPYANYMIASEGNIPNAGWTYGAMIPASFDTHNSPEPRELAISLVESFLGRQKQFALAGVAVDMSAWELKKVPPVTSAMNSLGNLLIASFRSEQTRKRIKSLLIQAHYDCQSYMFEQNIDIKDFCTQILENLDLIAPRSTVTLNYNDPGSTVKLATELRSRCRDVIEAIEDCILISGFSGGPYQYSNGISAFFPWTENIYSASTGTYRKLKFVKFGAPAWDQFLQLFILDVSRRSPQAVPESDEIGYFLPASPDSASVPTRNPAAHFEAVMTGGDNDDARTTNNPNVRTTNNPNVRTTNNPNVRTTNNPNVRTTNNPNVRTTNNPNVRTTNNPNVRTTNNPNVRTTNNPNVRAVANANRLLNSLGLAIIEFKNIATPWYVSGCSPKETKLDRKQTTPVKRKRSK